MSNNQHPKTFNESIQTFNQALRQICAVYVESVLSLWRDIKRLVKQHQQKASE